MAARKWTDEQRAEQAIKILEWQPWQHSTGAKSESGKRIVARNAYRGSFRERLRFAQWLLNMRNATDHLTPALFGKVALRCQSLGVELSTSIDHEQFFVDMALTNTIAAMAIEPNKIIYFYYRALIMHAAKRVVLPS